MLLQPQLHGDERRDIGIKNKAKHHNDIYVYVISSN
jgi:hypothetical protein